MSPQIYHESDGNTKILEGKTIGVIGYGNQGRAQALNMRDFGLNVIVGNIDDEYKKRAEEDGFKTLSISESVKCADYLFFLIPDEIMKSIFKNEILPYLKKNQAIIFASGYNIAFNLIKAPKNIDVLLIAPRMIGIGVRECFLNKKGYFSFISIHQNASGNAKEILLALAKAIGALSKSGIQMTFKQEAVLDLFTEQGYGPGFGQILMNSIKVLVDRGYPPEAAFVELIYSGEISYTYEKMTEVGLINQMNYHSQTSQYGSMSRAIKFRKISKDIRELQQQILDNIESGEFAKEWESKVAKIKFKFLKFFRSKISFAKLEKKARSKLKLPTFEQSTEVKYPQENEIEKYKEIEKQLQKFKEFYRER